MADYYTPEQLAQRFKMTEDEIEQLQDQGLLEPTVKNGNIFFSSHQAYRLKVAIQWTQKKQIALAEALSQVEERWLAATHAN
jgi:DNA-binding transcriptional MerR regulator